MEDISLLFREILSEDRVDFLKTKYEEAVWKKYNEKEHFRILENGNQVFIHLENADPTRKKIYLQWIINIYLSDIRFMLEDCYKVRNALELFDKNKAYLPANQRDINKFQIVDLYYVVEPFEQQEIVSNNEAERRKRQSFFDQGQAELVYQSDNVTIITPNTREAAQYFGRGTKWCTSARDHNYFDQYASEGPLYILLPMKWQFHFETESFMDERDEPLKNLGPHRREIIKALEPQFKKLVIAAQSISGPNLEGYVPLDTIKEWYTEYYWSLKNHEKNHAKTYSDDKPYLYMIHNVKYIVEAYESLDGLELKGLNKKLLVGSNPYFHTSISIPAFVKDLAKENHKIQKDLIEIVNHELELFNLRTIGVPLIQHSIQINYTNIGSIPWFTHTRAYQELCDGLKKRIKEFTDECDRLLARIQNKRDLPYACSDAIKIIKLTAEKKIDMFLKDDIDIDF
jgi:hypothetical protein